MFQKFISRYKYFLIGAILIFVALTLLLVVFSGGPQKGAFNYQIF